MLIIEDTPHYRVYWHDDDKTILIVEPYTGVTWDDALKVSALVNNLLAQEATDRRIYSITDFSQTSHFLPRGDNAIRHLYEMMQNDPGYEEMIIFAMPEGLLSPIVHLTLNLYGALPVADKYHFVKTIEQAFQLVEQDKAKHNSNDPIAKSLIQSEHYQIGWHNEDETILVIDGKAGWTWDDAHNCVKQANTIVSGAHQQRRIFTIYHFNEGAHLMPNEGQAIPNLYRLMKNDPGEDELIIYVARLNLIGKMMQSALKVYGALPIANKYRFVNTFKEALDIIEAHPEHRIPV